MWLGRRGRYSYVKNGDGEHTSKIPLKKIKYDTKKRLTVCQSVSNLTTHNQKMLFFVEDRSNSSTMCLISLKARRQENYFQKWLWWNNWQWCDHMWRVIARVFKKFWSAVGNHYWCWLCGGEWLSSRFKLQALLSVLRALSNSAPGSGGIPAVINKKFASVLASPLLTIFQRSLLSGSVPDQWKVTKVIALYKGKVIDC